VGEPSFCFPGPGTQGALLACCPRGVRVGGGEPDQPPGGGLGGFEKKTPGTQPFAHPGAKKPAGDPKAKRKRGGGDGSHRSGERGGEVLFGGKK